MADITCWLLQRTNSIGRESTQYNFLLKQSQRTLFVENQHLRLFVCSNDSNIIVGITTAYHVQYYKIITTKNEFGEKGIPKKNYFSKQSMLN